MSFVKKRNIIKENSAHDLIWHNVKHHIYNMPFFVFLPLRQADAAFFYGSCTGITALTDLYLEHLPNCS